MDGVSSVVSVVAGKVGAVSTAEPETLVGSFLSKPEAERRCAETDGVSERGAGLTIAHGLSGRRVTVNQ